MNQLFFNVKRDLANMIHKDILQIIIAIVDPRTRGILARVCKRWKKFVLQYYSQITEANNTDRIREEIQAYNPRFVVGGRKYFSTREEYLLTLLNNHPNVPIKDFIKHQLGKFKIRAWGLKPWIEEGKTKFVNSLFSYVIDWISIGYSLLIRKGYIEFLKSIITHGYDGWYHIFFLAIEHNEMDLAYFAYDQHPNLYDVFNYVQHCSLLTQKRILSIVVPYGNYAGSGLLQLFIYTGDEIILKGQETEFLKITKDEWGRILRHFTLHHHVNRVEFERFVRASTLAHKKINITKIINKAVPHCVQKYRIKERCEDNFEFWKKHIKYLDPHMRRWFYLNRKKFSKMKR